MGNTQKCVLMALLRVSVQSSQKTNSFLSTAAVVLRMSECWTAFICWCLVCEEGTMGVSGSTGGTWWCPVQQDFADVALRQVLVSMQEYLMHFICEFVHTYTNLLCHAFHCPQHSYPLNFNSLNFWEIPIGFSSHLVCFSVFLFWAVSFSLPLSFNLVRRVPGHVPCQLWMKSGPNRRTPLQSDSLYKAVKDASASCERRPETSTWSSMHIFTGWVEFTCPHFYCLIDESQ